MKSNLATMLILVALAWGASGCGNSLQDQDGKHDESVGTDDTPVDEFEVIEDINDDRKLPSKCEIAEDCNDSDPCTYDACISSKCVFVAHEIVLTETWVETGGSALDVKLINDKLYIAEGEDGVEVFSTTEIRSPEKLGNMQTTGSAWSVDSAGERAWVAEQATGLEIFNSNFEQTALRGPGTGAYTKGDTIEHVALGPTVLIVSAHTAGGLLTNKNGDNLLGQVNTAGRAVRAAVENDTWGLIADSLVGAIPVIFGSGEPPFLGGKITTNGRTMDVAVSGDTGLMAEYGAGFGVLNLSNPLKPKRLARVPSRAPVIGVALIGPQTAVVAEELGGRVSVYNLVNPFVPEVIATWDTGESESPKDGLIARNIDTNGDLIAVAMDTHGVLLLETGCSPE